MMLLMWQSRFLIIFFKRTYYIIWWRTCTTMEEEYLLNSIEPLRKIPNVLSRASETLFFSFGGATNGVNVANHGFTWIGLYWKKIWWLRRMLKNLRAHVLELLMKMKRFQTLKCLQHLGEIFVTSMVACHVQLGIWYRTEVKIVVI